MPLIPNMQTNRKGNALFTNWGGKKCLNAHVLGGRLLENNVSRRLLVKGGKVHLHGKIWHITPSLIKG